MALCPGLHGRGSTRKITNMDLLEQETVSGSGISWAICKPAPRPRQITMTAPHQSVFTGRMPFLPPNQQCQSTERKVTADNSHTVMWLNLTMPTYIIFLTWAVPQTYWQTIKLCNIFGSMYYALHFTSALFRV